MIEGKVTSEATPRAAWIVWMVAGAGWLIAGLALTRLFYEWRFPEWLWLGRPLPAITAALAVAAGGLLLTRRIGPGVAVVSLPLLLNLLWLVDPIVDAARSRFLFAAGLWLLAVLVVWLRAGDDERRWRKFGPLLIVLGLLPVYLATMSHAVGQADTFEFQVVAPRLGIVHPTGYPLYLLLGKLFSLLPFGSIAWRLNLASAVYAILAVIVVFRLGLELLRRPLPALAGAVALGLIPIYWSQAIIAEVYTLHALIVAVALRLMARLVADPPQPAVSRRKTIVALSFVIGLGLTNHLTTVFLLPPAAVTVALTLMQSSPGGRRWSAVGRGRSFLPGLAAFVAPLLLYAYLPLRWQAVNGEPMGLGRFMDWVVGGRFQGALQWAAWLRDPARWTIAGRLLIDAWHWAYLALAVIGLVWLFRRQWRAALVLLVTAAGFLFYVLNYYVPDLAVFLIPAHVVIAVWIAAGSQALLKIASPRQETASGGWPALVFTLSLLPALLVTGVRWPAVDQSDRDNGEQWARGVLGLPLAADGAILADSEKIAPLYYVQQTEDIRLDLDILVLPDEAAYRAELDRRLAAGQAVYLARFLPGLQGVYHLRSVGPLVEVSREPLVEAPADATPSEAVAGPLRLLGFRVESVATVDPTAAAITLYWTLQQPLAAGESPTLYTRWSSSRYGVETPLASGKHPAANYYPINAWRPGEIVADYHLLPVPLFACDQAGGCELDFQVAVAPRFSRDALEWITVTRVHVATRPGPVPGGAVRARLGTFLLDGASFAAQVRPGTPLEVRYSGYGAGPVLEFALRAPDATADPVPAGGIVSLSPNGASAQYAAEVSTDLPNGDYVLAARSREGGAALCGWLARPSASCALGLVEISGAPLPEGAVNFADRVALLDVNLPDATLTPGGQLSLELSWRALSPMSADYTVFVQVLDAADRIVGQVDSWPVQGTFPTSKWQPGQTVRDPYVVRLSSDLPPGEYRLNIGLYLLATLERLPVLDETGTAVDDKVEVSLTVD